MKRKSTPILPNFILLGFALFMLSSIHLLSTKEKDLDMTIKAVATLQVAVALLFAYIEAHLNSIWKKLKEKELEDDEDDR